MAESRKSLHLSEPVLRTEIRASSFTNGFPPARAVSSPSRVAPSAPERARARAERRRARAPAGHLTFIVFRASVANCCSRLLLTVNLGTLLYSLKAFGALGSRVVAISPASNHYILCRSLFNAYLNSLLAVMANYQTILLTRLFLSLTAINGNK